MLLADDIATTRGLYSSQSPWLPLKPTPGIGTRRPISHLQHCGWDTYSVRGESTLALRTIWRNNGLSITLIALFLLFLAGQSITGWHEANNEREAHAQAPMRFDDYLRSGSFIEVTAENWESEFLQMSVYVLFTVFLFQRGSSESKSPDKKEEVDRDPRRSRNEPDAPWPVRKGGLWLRLYESSLSAAFVLLFLASFAMHAAGGAANYNEEQRLHGEPTVDVWAYLATSRFWYESFQNWQSEFLAIACMVIFSIFLRQRGSPESKPVDAPHSETGGG
jgi:hypothetical protein